MPGYYDDKLSAERLVRCYKIAPPRVQQYLEAEIEHVLQRMQPGDLVLELGCGYGRVLQRLASKGRSIIGIDTSLTSLLLAREMLNDVSNCRLISMNALHLGFRYNVFDVVACIQNGISAFHVNHEELIKEAIRVTKPGGIVLFSSYSDKFWDDRLKWFRLQSDVGLLGEVDPEKTGDGVIVCKDGFTGTTVRPEQFLLLTAGLDVDVQLTEVDESSLFCEMVPR
jgi:SAM-dependent methyltransferase